MAFNPEEITRIGLGSEDYPAGEAVLGKYGWHILELILDDEGNWNSEVFLSNQMNATVEDIISKLGKSYYLEFNLESTWGEFKTFISEFGEIGSDISGSLNGEDFEDLLESEK